MGNDMQRSAPTSIASTRRTEPEIVAGITSGEGQPAAYEFDSTPTIALRPLVTLGVLAALGLVAGLGSARRR